MDALGRLPLGFRRLQPEPDVESANNQHLVLEFDFADRFRYQTLVRSVDLTRFQRASKGSRKSTGRGGDDVIESGRVRLDRSRRNFVVLRHRSVRSEDHRFALRGKIRAPDGTPDTFDAYFGPVDDFGHEGDPSVSHIGAIIVVYARSPGY